MIYIFSRQPALEILRQSRAGPQTEREKKYHFRGWAALDESLWTQSLSVKIKESKLTRAEVGYL